MIGAIVNAIGIILGGGIGTLLRSKINQKLVHSLTAAMGLVIMAIGIQGIVGSEDTLCLVVSLAVGVTVGHLLKIDDFIDGIGLRLTRFFAGKKFAEGKFADGFISATVLFTVGVMAIMGSLDAGLRGNYQVLFTKAVIDGVSAAAMSAAMGIGVLFAFVPVLIWEGALILLAGVVSPVLGSAVVAEMSAAGGAIFIAMGINMLGIGKREINVANFLPAILIPIAYVPLAALIGG